MSLSLKKCFLSSTKNGGACFVDLEECHSAFEKTERVTDLALPEHGTMVFEEESYPCRSAEGVLSIF